MTSIIGRLERFHRLKGRRSAANGDLHGHGRPLQVRAIVYTLLSTALRREELTNLDIGQLSAADPAALRAAKRARLKKVRGEGGISGGASSCRPMPAPHWRTTSRRSAP